MERKLMMVEYLGGGTRPSSTLRWRLVRRIARLIVGRVLLGRPRRPVLAVRSGRRCWRRRIAGRIVRRRRRLGVGYGRVAGRRRRRTVVAVGRRLTGRRRRRRRRVVALRRGAVAAGRVRRRRRRQRRTDRRTAVDVRTRVRSSCSQSDIPKSIPIAFAFSSGLSRMVR